MTADITPPAPQQPSLPEWDVSITLAHLPHLTGMVERPAPDLTTGGDRPLRTFHLTVPAYGPAEAHAIVTELGYMIATATRGAWKLAASDGQPAVTSAQPKVSITFTAGEVRLDATSPDAITPQMGGFLRGMADHWDPPTEPTPAQRLLELPLDEGNDAGAATVQDYLIELLRELWRRGELFSGKRPFGTAGWQDEIYRPMVKAGLISGTFDEDGGLDECDTAAADELIAAAILALAEHS